jgi:2-keto-4-pentenoate hydratase/2-oxohepta-3-ene-1,7-dioic acid hydratase in catechol pathway
VRLVTFRRGRGEPKPGALWQEHVLDLGGLAKDLAVQRGTVRRGRGGFPRSILEIVQGSEAVRALAREAVEHGQRLVGQTAAEELAQRRLAYPLKRVRLLAPIPSPSRNIFCLGRNYADHAAERGAAAPEHPVNITTPGTAVVGPGDDVVHLAITKELDYEVELTVVIGTGGRNIRQAQAYDHVYGYTIVNDVTARTLQNRHKQWFLGKSLDGYCPMGPCVVTADEIEDVTQLRLLTKVNGEVRQDAYVSQLIFDIPMLIATLSKVMTLEPGDLIATGTCAGVGIGFDPPRFLKPGDTVSVTIEPIGTLENPVT